MKIFCIFFGKTTDKHLSALIDDYTRRVAHYCPVEMHTLPEGKGADALRQCLKPGDHVVLLDEHGEERRSVDFARWMQKRMASGTKRLVLVVGGPFGFDDDMRSMAQEFISLSRMTFSHQMVRLFMVEQIYRAMTILRGEPYHHE